METWGDFWQDERAAQARTVAAITDDRVADNYSVTLNTAILDRRTVMSEVHPNAPATKKSASLSGQQKRLLRKLRGTWTEENERRERERIGAHKRRNTKKRSDALAGHVKQVKLTRGCADCGYRGHFAALHFDHLPGQNKKKNLSQIRSSKTTADAEMAKCEVVCANCHAIRTYNRRYGNTGSAQQRLFG